VSRHLPPVLDEETLPEAALRAAVLDGELFPLGDGYCLIDVPLDADCRGRSLRALAVHGRALADRTAAWVWGAVPELTLPRTTVCSPTAAVGHTTGTPGLGTRSRIARLRVADIAHPGGVAVTSPWRTAIDLACARTDDIDDEVLLALIELAGASVADVLADLATRSRLRGRTRGAARLQVLVTR